MIRNQTQSRGDPKDGIGDQTASKAQSHGRVCAQARNGADSGADSGADNGVDDNGYGVDGDHSPITAQPILRTMRYGTMV